MDETMDDEKVIDQVMELLKRPEDAILFNLGVAYQYHGATEKIFFSADYAGLGKRIWASLRYELHAYLCENGKPKEWVNEIVSGDARDFVVAIIAVLVSKMQVAMGIAVPAAALIIKMQMHKYCAISPEQPPYTTRELLEKQENWFKSFSTESRKTNKN
jgi:hypothetical protein